MAIEPSPQFEGIDKTQPWMNRVPKVTINLDMSDVGNAITDFGNSAAKDLTDEQFITDSEMDDQEKLNQEHLTEHIKKHGVQTPIELLHGKDENLKFLNGHHRYIAARKAGLTHIPATIYSHSPDAPLPDKYLPEGKPE